MKSSRGYDQLARFYRLIEFFAFGRALERARFHHFDRLRDCKRILLLGDGDGRGLALACRLAPHARIESVDFSAGMLDRAARRLQPEDHARVTLRQADALTAEFPADTYDAVTTLFFLDCFSNEQVHAFIGHLRPSLTADAIWLHADFSLPERGFHRLRARVMLTLMLTFFRWQTGLSVRALPHYETLLHSAGFRRIADASWQGGFIVSSIFQQVAK
ncbi:MAG TPA: class I SAM-dependent methyltransferase [Rariglobus sp.]|nr:class I SAM-dependent methyltransferase [Rariglobus sp.]